jgi:hypothetical protein
VDAKAPLVKFGGWSYPHYERGRPTDCSGIGRGGHLLPRQKHEEARGTMATQLVLDGQETEAKADLIQVDRALESWRDAGYDLPAALGEVVDNSIEAGAKTIRIEAVKGQSERGRRGKGSIEAIAVSDDGTGTSLMFCRVRSRWASRPVTTDGTGWGASAWARNSQP